MSDAVDSSFSDSSIEENDSTSLSSVASDCNSSNEPDWMKKFTRRPSKNSSFINQALPTTALNCSGEDDWIEKFNKFRVSDLTAVSSNSEDDMRKSGGKAKRRERIRQNLKRLQQLKSQEQPPGVMKHRKNDTVSASGSTKCDESNVTMTDIKSSKNKRKMKHGKNLMVNSTENKITFFNNIIANRKNDKKQNKSLGINSTLVERDQYDSKVEIKSSTDTIENNTLTKSLINNIDFNSRRNRFISKNGNAENLQKDKKPVLKHPSTQSKTGSISSSYNSHYTSNHEAKITGKSVDQYNNNSPQSNQHVQTKACKKYQPVIETSVPNNLMDMWGVTVKSKKPNNASSMSHRTIRNQADKVKERIANARKTAGSGNDLNRRDDSDEFEKEGSGIQIDPNESASALFFRGENVDTDQGKDSIGTINAEKEHSARFNNSAAAFFGFQATSNNSNSNSKDTGDDNNDNDENAAALFYQAAATTQNETDEIAKFEEEKQKSLASNKEDKDSVFDDLCNNNEDAAALFYRAADETDEMNMFEEEKEKSPSVDNSTNSDEGDDIDAAPFNISEEQNDNKIIHDTEKKSLAGDSDIDSLDVDSLDVDNLLRINDLSKNGEKSEMEKSSFNNSDTKLGQKQGGYIFNQSAKKKSWLDDSSSDSSSDSGLWANKRKIALTATQNLRKADKTRAKDREDKGLKKRDERKDKSKSVLDSSKKKKGKGTKSSKNQQTLIDKTDSFSDTEFDDDNVDDTTQVRQTKKKKKIKKPKEKKKKDRKKSSKKKKKTNKTKSQVLSLNISK